MTTGSFDDVIVTLNLALVSVLERIQNGVSSWVLESLLRRLATMVDRIGDRSHEGLFMTRSVEELLLGYDDPILKTVSRFTKQGTQFSFMGNGTKEENSCDWSHISMINTGIMDIHQIGQVLAHSFSLSVDVTFAVQYEMWNGQTEITSWNNHSEIIHGTSGEFFRPFLKGSEKLSIWVPDMYRTMPLYKESETDLDDVHMFRYRIVREIDRTKMFAPVRLFLGS